MRDVFRAGLRVIAVCGLLFACGGLSCTDTLGGIEYAPGYGFVVKVQHNDTMQVVKQSYYYVFDTYEQAKHFVDTRYTDPNWPDTGSGRRYHYQWEKTEYDEITKLLGPPPDLTIPLANPELPQPIPQTPQ